MTLLFDSFWRAAVYCLRPRVIALSFLPLLLLVALALGLGYFYWDAALDGVRHLVEASSVLSAIGAWLQSVGAGKLKSVVAPLIVIFTVTPVLILVSLLTVSVLMTPTLTALVAERRFPALEKKQGSNFLQASLWSLGSSAMATAAMLLSIPLWLMPPLILILPPLIWGWLSYRVLAYDVLADYASKEEQRLVFKRHYGWLLLIGVLTGYLGAAPSLLWASGALFAAAFVLLVPLAIWIYTLVFAFSSLWFAHYCLAALERLRAQTLSPPLNPLDKEAPSHDRNAE